MQVIMVYSSGCCIICKSLIDNLQKTAQAEGKLPVLRRSFKRFLNRFRGEIILTKRCPYISSCQDFFLICDFLSFTLCSNSSFSSGI